ncbi:MAG TPA: GreA/GreB family elongation factor [Rhabdochlamydiaceae bacterium]|nr:GreA/GreB family elongation factor [Rhabdochlamydiaceae bacterium]
MSICHFQKNQGIQMGYLKEFQTQIANHDYPACLRLWEEYCSADEVDGQELKEILLALKHSDLAESFGRHVDRILPLWHKMEESPIRHDILKLIIDLETSNSESLRELAYDYIKSRYGDQKHFNEKIRLIGLRGKDQFQGAISNYELLSHMEKGNYAFHSGGWGVGEIIDVSLVREQLSLEFDYVAGRKDLSFQTAFKNLIPLPKDHFLAMRFGNPDLLEKQAKEHPVEVIRILLRDLGPKTAAEIKDELCELVIPTNEWIRWWQTARTKIKKDTMIETPEELRDPFRLRHSEVTHEERLSKALENKPDANTLIHMVYSFMKDFSETLKNADFKTALTTKITEFLSFQEITDSQELQLHFFLEDLSDEKNYPTVNELIKSFSSLEDIIQGIEIQSFKKRALIAVRKTRSDWSQVFLNLIFTVDQNPLRDYLLNELLSSDAVDEVKKKLEDLYIYPSRNPDAFLWYFQKLVSQPNVPFADKEGKNRFFEAFLILLSFLEQATSHRDMIKKMHSILSSGRYAVVRQIMQGASLKEVQEFLLLATKCHSLSDHDIKILHSLAEVVHPSLQKTRKKQEPPSQDSQTIWTTQEGYQKLQQRIQQIATVETIENAKEIEIARSHGDLRENAEFKSALEKRDRLQTELKFLSEQLNRSRILTKDDITTEEVGIGSIVECKSNQGTVITYTLLGPWDADPDQYILSFQSKLAQEMKGLKKGDKFKFQGDELTITSIKSFLNP